MLFLAKKARFWEIFSKIPTSYGVFCTTVYGGFCKDQNKLFRSITARPGKKKIDFEKSKNGGGSDSFGSLGLSIIPINVNN